MLIILLLFIKDTQTETQSRMKCWTILTIFLTIQILYNQITHFTHTD